MILMCFDVAVSALKLNWSPFAVFRTDMWPFFSSLSFTVVFRERLPDRVVRFVVASRHTFCDGFVCGAAPNGLFVLV